MPNAAPLSVHLLLWDGVELLDFAGPGQVFAVAGRGTAFQVRTVAARPGPVRSQGFLQVVPDLVLDQAPPADILVIPGGETDRAVADPAFMAGFHRAAPEAGLLLSVCTGARILAAAGLLEGLTVTTWHGALGRLRTEAPAARVVSGVRWVDNGGVVTAAGVSAGIDAALHVVGRLLGDVEARRVARYMEYSPPRGEGASGMVVEPTP
jgi:transcriptional regulator GlxA family with amidase domain